jgi:hypothetical protein
MSFYINNNLLKIIQSYLIFDLPFKTELIYLTSVISLDLNNWRYYYNHCIRYDNGNLNFKIGDAIYRRYKILNLVGNWNIN